MFNISPVGRNCSREERNDYEKFDLEHDIRKNMVAAMKEEFKDLDLTYSIGGQISFDCFPTGWDKTYCLKFLNPDDFDEIHFFGACIISFDECDVNTFFCSFVFWFSMATNIV